MVAWIPLVEFSSKYNVSISTLRRRIKSRTVHFRLEDGKYFLLDEAPIITNPRVPTFQIPTHTFIEVNNTPATAHETNYTNNPESYESNQQTSLNAAVRTNTSTQPLVEEIKKAYTYVLQEKEQQICLLNDEIADLRTLINVLERESRMLSEQLARD